MCKKNIYVRNHSHFDRYLKKENPNKLLNMQCICFYSVTELGKYWHVSFKFCIKHFKHCKRYVHMQLLLSPPWLCGIGPMSVAILGNPFRRIYIPTNLFTCSSICLLFIKIFRTCYKQYWVLMNQVNFRYPRKRKGSTIINSMWVDG